MPADFILVSHGRSGSHNDAVEIARRTGALVIANFQVAYWLNKNGAPKIHPLNHGGGFQFDFGRAKFVNAIHSSTLPDGTYSSNPGSFVVESAEGNFYFSGDTALTMDMNFIGKATRAEIRRALRRRQFSHDRR